MDWLIALLDTGVLLVSFVLKAPQIVKVLRSGTTRGISFNSLLLECWCFNVLLTYPCARGYPLSSYSEFVLLVIQDLLLVALVMHERRLVTPRNLALLAAALAFFVATAMGTMHEWILVTLISVNTPISATSKVLQLSAILRTRDAGSVSPGTWAMGTATSAARIVTKLLGESDIPLLLVSIQGFVFSAAICAAATVYAPGRRKSSRLLS